MKGSGAAEERRRGQRLFGALLGTLSQSSTTKAQRRRADVEKRQLGKLQQRDEELEEEKRRKLEKLNLLRTKEQNVWDEQNVQAYHRLTRLGADTKDRCVCDIGTNLLRRIS